MRNFILVCFSLIFIADVVFSSDLVSQKVALTVDKKSAYFNYDLIFEKSVLSSSQNGKAVKLLDGENEMLRLESVSNVSAIVQIKTVRKSQTFGVELYTIEGKPELLDNSIEFDTNDFIDAINDVSEKIISVLAKKFPEKPVSEIVQVEKVKVNFSEFESVQPSWRVRWMPIVGFTTAYFSVNTNNNGGSENTAGATETAINYNASAEIDFQFHEWSGSLFVSGGYPVGNNQVRLGAGYGLFGSVIVLGISVDYFSGSFQTSRTISYGDWGQPPIAELNFPSLFWQTAGIESFLKINFNENYSIEAHVGSMQWSEAYINFRDESYDLKYLHFNSGGPNISLALILGLFPNFQFVAYFGMNSSSYSRNNGNNGNGKMDVPSVKGGSPAFYLNEFRVTQSQLGIGITYAL